VADEHPRPLLRRAAWTSLDGPWAFALDPDARWRTPADVAFDREIVVPFSPETPASGVADTSMYRACWYRRGFRAPELRAGERLWLRFGAVDHHATVWLNGAKVVEHEGGYTPFGADVTELLAESDEQDIVVRAFDDPTDLEKPRGKQDWEPDPHIVWYPRTTGIWQTVWLEVVPESHVAALRWRPDVPGWGVELEARVGGPPRDDLRLELTLRAGDALLADDSWSVREGEVHRRVGFNDPGIYSERQWLLWSPEQPTLLEAELRLTGPEGVVDRVSSYTALRSVRVEGEHVLLNDRPLELRLVLDQGYWPDTGLTAPDVAAMERDIELVQALGFNGVRCHQKIEDPRWLRVADERGLLVWGEMPSAYRFTRRAADRITREWLAILERDVSHPCIVAWVPFNESWGIPDVARDPAQRDLVRALYHLTKAVDPERPVIGNDGWEAVVGDLVCLHDYERDPVSLLERLTLPDDELSRQRFFGHLPLLEGDTRRDRPLLLTEFGGMAFTAASEADQTWGYDRTYSSEDFLRRYRELMAAVHASRLAGFCYTQLTDTYQEANGLLTFDREPKAPLVDLAAATVGAPRLEFEAAAPEGGTELVEGELSP
jgi:Glycosyl hydrolases family 2, sugar binding domain/Glycosyl hydrolases family 2, TIM barrel domain